MSQDPKVRRDDAFHVESVRRPIRRSLLIGGVIFTLALCIVICLLSYYTFSNYIYRNYQDRLDDVITHVEHYTDADDLRRCIESGETSEDYARLQSLLNTLVDDFELDYLYVVIPSEETMTNVISATSAAETAAGETDMPLLETSDAYPKEELLQYLSAWNADSVVYFRESSGWGDFYTACKPLRASSGETVALICADLSMDQLHQTISRHMLFSLLLILLVSVLFSFLMLIWLRRNVTTPLLQLEKSARSFANRSYGMSGLRQTRFEIPTLTTQNEIQSLAEAIQIMKTNMLSYIEDILSAEQRAKNAELEAQSLTTMAFQDPLTHVKSAAAYQQKAQELSALIIQRRAQFALVMVDLNDLKLINDRYGHENGDRYLIGSCGVICRIYKHSPVYRVGGDEFVVVLQGTDYAQREWLKRSLEESYRRTMAENGLNPWERYSAAVGMAVYEWGDSFDSVFKRADEEMYASKQKMKAELALYDPHLDAVK